MGGFVIHVSTERVPRELARFSARTRGEPGVIWSAQEGDTGDRVHYMVERTGGDAPGGAGPSDDADAGDSPPSGSTGGDHRDSPAPSDGGETDTGTGTSAPGTRQRPESAETKGQSSESEEGGPGS